MGGKEVPLVSGGGLGPRGGKLDKFLGPRGYSPAPPLPGPVSMAISPLSNYNPISSQPDNIYRFGPEGREGLGKFAVPKGGVGLQLSRSHIPLAAAAMDSDFDHLYRCLSLGLNPQGTAASPKIPPAAPRPDR